MIVGRTIRVFDTSLSTQPPHYIGQGPYAAIITHVCAAPQHVHVKVFAPGVAPIDWETVPHESVRNPAVTPRYWRFVE